MKNSISLCMIVKNEEKVLDRCLKSVEGIVDEIVIVDSGSTDKTKEIAMLYTNKIFDYTWDNDFSKARNYASEKATSEWILILDADEFVDSTNLKQIKDFLSEEINYNYDSFVVKINNFLGDNGEQIIQHKSERLYKNFKGIHFERAIHEQLNKKNSKSLLSSEIDLIIYHSGYLNKTHLEKNKSNRNVPLLEKEMSKSKNIAFDNFNLGNELFSQGKISEALKCYQEAFRKKADINLSWVGMSVVQIVNCLIRLDKNNDALEVINDAEQIWKNNVDFACLKASIFLKQKRYNDANEILIDVIRLDDDQKHCIMNLRFKDFFPMKLLGEIYLHNKDYNKSIEYFIKAHNIFDKDLYISQMIQKILVEQSQSNEVEIFEFLKKIRIITDENEKYNFLKLVIEKNKISKNLFNVVKIDENLEKHLLLLDKTRNFITLDRKVINYKSLVDDNSLLKIIQSGKISINELLYLNILFDTNYFTKYNEKSNNSMVDEYIKGINKNVEISINYLDEYIDLISYFMKFDNLMNVEKIIFNLEETYSDSDNQKILKERLGNLFFEYGYFSLSYEKFRFLDTLDISEESLRNLLMIYEYENMEKTILEIVLERLNLKIDVSFDIVLKALKISNSLQFIESTVLLEAYMNEKYPRSNEIKDYFIFSN